MLSQLLHEFNSVIHYFILIIFFFELQQKRLMETEGGYDRNRFSGPVQTEMMCAICI